VPLSSFFTTVESKSFSSLLETGPFFRHPHFLSFVFGSFRFYSIRWLIEERRGAVQRDGDVLYNRRGSRPTLDLILL
jgi:hypothetical protein